MLPTDDGHRHQWPSSTQATAGSTQDFLCAGDRCSARTRRPRRRASTALAPVHGRMANPVGDGFH